MPVTSRVQLKAWFQRGLKPLANQFASWMDAYWHKDEDQIPMEKIDGLAYTINGLASNIALSGLSDVSVIFNKVAIDTSGDIDLDFGNDTVKEALFLGNANIAADANVNFSHAVAAFRFTFLFSITAGVGLTFVNTKMSDALWADGVWTAADDGLYKAVGDFDGANWIVTITGPNN